MTRNLKFSPLYQVLKKKLYRRGVAHAGHWNGCEWRQSVFRYNTEIFRSILRVFRCFWEDFSSKSCPSGKISRLADFQAAENVLMPHQKNDPPCFGHFSRTVQAFGASGKPKILGRSFLHTKFWISQERLIFSWKNPPKVVSCQASDPKISRFQRAYQTMLVGHDESWSCLAFAPSHMHTSAYATKKKLHQWNSPKGRFFSKEKDFFF